MNIKTKNLLVRIGFVIIFVAAIMGFISLFLKGYKLSYLGEGLLKTYKIDTTPFEPIMLNVMVGNKMRFTYGGIGINENLLELSYRMVLGYAAVLTCFIMSLIGILSKNINKKPLAIILIIISLVSIVVFSTVNDAIVFNSTIDDLIKENLGEYGFTYTTKSIWTLATSPAIGITVAKTSGIISLIGSLMATTCLFIQTSHQNVIVKMETPNYSSVPQQNNNDNKIS